MPLHRPGPGRPPELTPRPAGAWTPFGESLVAAQQPLLEHVAAVGTVEEPNVARAWELYETPEVRFACRQYSNAFASAKLLLGRRPSMGKDPVPLTEFKTPAEKRAQMLLETFAGGADGQAELLDRMGTYFVVPGDMVLVGAYDPDHMMKGAKFAKWDVWSTSEVRWNGQAVTIRTSPREERFDAQPSYVKHVRVWNRHPRFGWLSDSPVLSALKVLELVGLYDDRLQAEALSRIVGAGVWFIPQGMKLPTATGDPAGGTPNDFLRLLMEIASIAVKDRRAAAARVPVLVEAAAEDIEAASKGPVDFWSPFDENLQGLQEAAIRRWATGVDLPSESMLGLSAATHWNASLITEDKLNSFIVPSLKRAVGNLTGGWLHPAMEQFGEVDRSVVLWFDPSGIKTRVDTTDETEWASDRFMVADGDTKYALGLGQVPDPTDEQLKRQLLLHMARMKPETVPAVLQELGIEVGIPVAAPGGAGVASGRASPAAGGRPGPQAGQETQTAPSNGHTPGRTARLGTTRG